VLLNRNNFQIAELAPDDEERLTMCGILVAPNRTVVTNGHMAVVVSAVDTIQPSLFEQIEGIEPAESFTPFILDRDSAIKIAKRIPKDTEDNPVFPIIDATTEGNDRAMVSINDIFRQEILRATKIAGDFPDVQRAIPDKEAARFTLLIDPELLTRLLKAVVRFCDGRAMEMRLYGAGRPVRIDAGDAEQSLVAVIMPLRGDAVPEAARSPAPAVEQSAARIPSDPDAEEWRTESEIAEGVPHHILP
jgi:hypothetical protein